MGRRWCGGGAAPPGGYQKVGSLTRRWIQRMVPAGVFSQVWVRREDAWLAFGGQDS